MAAIEATELTFTKPGGVEGKTKYLRLEDDIYVLGFQSMNLFTDYGAVITAIIDQEGLTYSVCRFFIVLTQISNPTRFPPGGSLILRVQSSLEGDQVSISGFTQALDLQEVRETFSEEIGQAV